MAPSTPQPVPGSLIHGPLSSPGHGALAFSPQQRRRLDQFVDAVQKQVSLAPQAEPSRNTTGKRKQGATSNHGPSRPAKKVKRWTEQQIEPKVRGIVGDKPLQKIYPIHRVYYDDQDIHDFLKSLSGAMLTFAGKYFATKLEEIKDHGREKEPKSHWPHMPRAFVEYTEAVAEADASNGGWNEFLDNEVHRKYLVMAILMRIFEKNIFNELLFGADDQEKDFLLGLDKALFTSEGFSRNALRAQSVRTILGSSPVPKDFYVEVGTLTEQIAILLEPLANLFCRPNIQASLYQELHNIVSDAAYISIVFRTCQDIFFFNSISPGAPYDTDDQLCLDIDLYRRSKAEAEAKYPALQERVKNSRQTNDDDSVNNAAPRITHRALTMMSIWPCIRRFKAGSGTPDGINNGFRVRDVTKAAVLSYYGPADKSIRSISGRSLEQVYEDSKASPSNRVFRSFRPASDAIAMRKFSAQPQTSKVASQDVSSSKSNPWIRYVTSILPALPLALLTHGSRYMPLQKPSGEKPIEDFYEYFK